MTTTPSPWTFTTFGGSGFVASCVQCGRTLKRRNPSPKKNEKVNEPVCQRCTRGCPVPIKLRLYWYDGGHHWDPEPRYVLQNGFSACEAGNPCPHLALQPQVFDSRAEAVAFRDALNDA